MTYDAYADQLTRSFKTSIRGLRGERHPGPASPAPPSIAPRLDSNRSGPNRIVMNMRLPRHVAIKNLAYGIQQAVQSFNLQFQLARQLEPD